MTIPATEHHEACRVLRWVVPVDDQIHTIGRGPVVLVACRPPTHDRYVPDHVVEVWTEEYGYSAPSRPVRVYGTGQAVDAEGPHLGTALDGQFVWHVYAMFGEEQRSGADCVCGHPASMHTTLMSPPPQPGPCTADLGGYQPDRPRPCPCPRYERAIPLDEGGHR